jgi:phosphoglycerol transferase
VVATVQLRLWDADWNVPFSYQTDALFNGMLVKGLKDNAWFMHNAFVGAPGQQWLHDFPKSYTAQFLVLKTLTWFCSNYASAMNLYYLVTYPLIMVVSCMVLVSLGLSRTAAFLSSALFTFLPFHFSRGETHLLLAAYVSVPLAVWLIVRVHGASLFGSGRGNGANESEVPEASRKRKWGLVGVFALVVLIASWGVYYAFFAIALILVSGAAAWLWDRRRSAVMTALVLSAGITLSVAVNLAPSFVYWQQHGRNAKVANRNSGEAETYGLKLSQLLLPATGHRVAALAALKARYSKYARSVAETDDGTLGILGSGGFLFLLGLLLRQGPWEGPWDPPRTSAIGQSPSALTQPLGGRQNNNDLPRWLRVFAVCNLGAFLLGTVGGFGSLIALGGFAAIRSYSRLCVFIAFFAFGALGFLVDRALMHPRLAHRRGMANALLFAVLALGLWDQTPATASPDHTKLRADFLADRAFVQSIEQVVPQGSMIFQLPYVPFPESLSTGHMGEYSLARGYLHSRALRWSFGAMKGRADDRWQKETANLPTSAMVVRLRQAGFAGIYLDRSGYPDGGGGIEALLRQAVGPPALASNARELAFYPLVPLPPIAP